MLAAVAAELDASLAAAHLVPLSKGPIELLAAGGPQAATLGPPGRIQATIGDGLRALAVELTGQTQTSSEIGKFAPWSDHPHALSIALLLEDSQVCLLSVACDKPIDRTRLFDGSAIVGLLSQMIVYKRDVAAHRQQLHDLQQDRSLLTAGLHHDLKGPLTSIMGSARTLLSRYEDLDDDTRITLLAGITAQSERLNRMLTDTLSLQSSDPNAPVRKMNTRLLELTERVATNVSGSPTGRIVVECPDICIVTDPDRLERALCNLVDNALRYSPTGVPVHLIVEDEGAHIVITVADNGPGVSSDVLPGLFTPYATDPARSDGTGLGLHSVRNLVEELSGRVGYSRHSEWTRFTITLPREQGEPS
jgi:signal transduction histidine kinase